MILTAREANRLHHVGLELGASIVAFDATDLQRLGRFFGELPGPIDHVLVSGPGPCYVPQGGRRIEAARSDVGTHLSVPLSVARNAAGDVRPGGTLLFLGTTGGPAVPGFTFTAALRAITKSLALELRADTCEPDRGRLRRHAALVVGPRRSPQRARCEQLRATLPIRRLVASADVAALAVHLMANTAVTGATIEIDGGQQLVER